MSTKISLRTGADFIKIKVAQPQQDMNAMENEKELWGRRFKIVKNGLDETEVYSFVDSLTNQYSNLAKQLEHLDSLVGRLAHQYNHLSRKLEYLDSPADEHMQSDVAEIDDDKLERPDFLRTSSNGHTAEVDRDRLADFDSLMRYTERTIIEAAKQANSIKTEIEEKAKAKAVSIVARAEEKAQVEAYAVIAETEMRAKERGEEIIAAAQREAQELIEAAQQRGEAVNASAQDEAEQKAQGILGEAKKRAEESAELAKQGAEQLLAKGKQISQDDIKEVFENIHQSLLSIVEVSEKPPARSTKKGSAVPERPKTKAAGQVQTETTPDETQEQHPPRQEEGTPGLFIGTVELALAPPVVLDRMLQLHKHLKQTPHVDVLNLGGSVDRGITIRVVVQDPIPLLKVIGKLPEVNKVSEELPDADKTVPGRQTGEETPIRRIIITTKG
jgi:vacuolar-type H+-ATPase subunit H